LVSKEVRGAALDQLVQTMDPEDKALLKRVKMLRERFRVRDLPTDIIVNDDEAEQILAGMAEQQCQMVQAEQMMAQAQMAKTQADTQVQQVKAQKEMATIEPTILEILSRVEGMERNAKVKEDAQQLDAIKTMLEALVEKEEPAKPAAKPAAKKASKKQ